MSWQDAYRQGSFRGVPFNVVAHEGEFGRRTVTHEYPQRDKPYVEDLGRKARTLKVEALVIGADYMAARDRLLAAIEQPGPGRLVHPYLGELQVSVLGVTLRESTAQGGVAGISFECVESGELVFPTNRASTSVAVNEAALRARAAVEAYLIAKYAVREKPDYLFSSAASILTDALAQMQQVAGSVRERADQVAAIAQAAKLVNQQIIAVIYTPASAAQALVTNLDQLVREVAAGPREAIGLARVFFRFGSTLPPVPYTTDARKQQSANQAAMVQLVRTTALAEAARASAELAFDSYDEALTLRTELSDAIDALMDDGVGDELYSALGDLRSAVVRDVTVRGADLARVVAYTPALTLPALALAYELYGDAARAEEIVSRNAVVHPGFLPGQRALEVLTDA